MSYEITAFAPRFTAGNAYYGVDTNGDGQVDPVAGEAGALVAYQQGEYMATLILTPGA